MLSPNGFCRLAPQASPAFCFFHRNDPVKCVINRVIAGATTEISLETKGKILLLLFRKARRRHEHARRAKAALVRLGTEKRLLHRMKLAVVRQPLKRGDFAAFASKSGHETTMNRFAIEPDRAGTAIARVASFLHVKPSEVPKECSQTLAGPRFSAKCLFR